MHRSTLRRIILGGYVALMLAALLLPVPAAPDSVPRDADKLGHVALFLGFGLLAAWAAPGGRGRRAAAALTWTVGFAVVTELLQAVLPYRTGDPLDLVADLAGGLIGGLLGTLPRNR